MTARKFLFGHDFRGPPPDQTVDAAASEAALADAFARGRDEGRREANGEAERRLELALAGIGTGLSGILAEIDGANARTESEALRFFTALAEKLAGNALAAYPLAPIAEAAEEAFKHLRGVPHLAVRVNETLVEQVEALTRKMSRERGYEGRLIILGDEDIRPGDARIEWADGGIVRSRHDIETAVEAVLAGTR